MDFHALVGEADACFSDLKKRKKDIAISVKQGHSFSVTLSHPDTPQRLELHKTPVMRITTPFNSAAWNRTNVEKIQDFFNKILASLHIGSQNAQIITVSCPQELMQFFSLHATNRAPAPC